MFKNLELKAVYTSDSSNIAENFYTPLLINAVSFDRISAYFSVKALSTYAKGLEYFGRKNNRYRLIISYDIPEDVYNEIKKGYALKSKITEDMQLKMIEELSLEEEKNISNLAYLISLGIVEIKIAFKTKGIFHDKCGILVDEIGDIVCFRGSNNETEAAIASNYESFQVFCSWKDFENFYNEGIKESQNEFQKLWKDQVEGVKVLPANEVILKNILSHNKGKMIAENVLLTTNSFILDYDNDSFFIICNVENISILTKEYFYNRKLYPHIINSHPKDNLLRFKDTVSYEFIQRIDELLQAKIPPLGFSYYSTNRLKIHLKEKIFYINERASLGALLKEGNSEKYYKKRASFDFIINRNMKRKLRDKQRDDSFYMLTMKKVSNFSVPGSGKTASVLGTYCYLKAAGFVDRIVMIGPKNSFSSWKDEFQLCLYEELNCFDIQDSKYKNKEAKKTALLYDSGNYNLLLFNFESVNSYINEISNIVKDKTLLVIDEVHRVKRIEGKNAKGVLKISKETNYAIALTGTPVPNSYCDIYNLLNILYNNEYKDFFGFDDKMLKSPSDDDIEKINETIYPFYCRTTKNQLGVPLANDDIIEKIPVTEIEQEIIKILNMKYRKNPLALIIRLLQAESNPKMLLKSLELSDFNEILDVSVDKIEDIEYKNYAEEISELFNSIDNTSKKNACLDLAKELVENGKSVIIWCIFVDSILSIKKQLQKSGIMAECIFGATEDEERIQIINGFKNKEYKVLITNPHTLAESISLHSVCHDAIYFEYSYNLVHLLQSKDRIHRLGLDKNQYTQYYFMQSTFQNYDKKETSIDGKILERLKYKEQLMIDAIENKKFEIYEDPEEDLNFIFEDLKLK